MGYYLKRFKNLVLRAVTLTKYNTIYSQWYCETCKKQVKSDHECANDYKKIGHEIYYLGLNKPKPPMMGEEVLCGSPLAKLPTKIDYRPIMQSGGWRVRDQGSQGCFSADTEVLTQNGWKRFPDVAVSDTLATLNEDGIIEYQRPTQYFDYDYDGDMYHCSKKGLDFLVTPNHNIYCRKWDQANGTLVDKPGFIRADQLGWYSGLLRTGSWKGTDRKSFLIDGKEVDMNAWLWFLGIYVAEGCVTPFKKPYTHQSVIEIAAVAPRKRQVIQERLNRLPWHIGVLNDRFRIHNKELWEYLKPLGQSKTKRVPNFIKDLPPHRIEQFLEAFILGDGHRVPKRHNCKSEVYMYTSSPKLADDLQELLLKTGKCANVRSRERDPVYIKNHWANASTSYELFIKNRKTACIERNKGDIQIEKYSGKVYCFEVPNHTLYVRRNGTPLWLGNSCTAQAGVCDKAYQEIKKGNYPGPFSAAYIYYEERKLHNNQGQDSGAYMADIGTVLGKNGVCLESNMPYRDYDYTTAPKQEDHDQAKEWKCQSKQTRIWDENALKQALVNGPVRIGVPIPRSFWDANFNGGFVPCTYDAIQGYHAMTALGYDDNLTSPLGQKGHFIVCNSWGQFFGDKGYNYIPYAWIGHYKNNNDHRQQFDLDDPFECVNGQSEVLELCETDPSRWKKRRVCTNNKWEVEYQDCPNCKEGEIDILEYCTNDPERWKTRKVCKDGTWVTETQDCPEDPEPTPKKTRYQIRKSDDGGANWVILYDFGW